MLWVSLLTFPLMTAVQEICDRTALATGKSLGELATVRWRSRPARMLVGALLVGLLAANALNIAADLVAVGSGMTLLHAGPTWLWALLAGVAITALVMFGSFARIAWCSSCSARRCSCYFVVAVMVHPPGVQVLRGTFVPQLHSTHATSRCWSPCSGTTISPYLFFWQSAHRLEDMRDEPEERPPRRPAGGRRTDEAHAASCARPGWT